MIFSKKKSTTAVSVNNQQITEQGTQGGEGTTLSIGGNRGDTTTNILDSGAIEAAFDFASEGLQLFSDGTAGAVSAIEQSNSNVLSAKNAETKTITTIVIAIAVVIGAVMVFGGKR